jgi:hypothetical protein
MAEIKFNTLPFKTLEDWEKTQVNAGDEELLALQKSISKELRRRKAEKKQAEIFEKWAIKHGYEITKKPESKEAAKTPEGKPDEKKPAAAAPFKM